MKVAIVHDYIKEYGGAERVLEALHALYPESTVFTSVYLPEFLGPHKERFKDWKIKTSFFQYVPFNYKLISPFRLLSPLVFGWDFSEFDVVIVSATGAYFPNAIRTKSNQQKAISKNPLHICYCHTPPRYLYGYATARDWQKNKIVAFIGHLVNHFLRMIDYKASKNVDFYIANSREVKGRIEKFYRREATVIYPPVEVRSAKSEVRSQSRNPKSEIRNYYLTGGRLARAKHVDLIIKACQEMRVPLKVFGRGFAGYDEELKAQILNSPRGEAGRKSDGKIEFLGEVTDAEKLKLMAGAKAFLFASEDEDFGIIPVEAMSMGTPVIAYKSGGVKETVVEGKTGVFFEKLDAESLKDAIKRFENIKINPEDCRKQAEKFSKERFQSEIKDFINEKLK